MVIAIDGTTMCDEEGRVRGGIEHYTWSIIFSLPRQFPEHQFVVVVPKRLPASVQHILSDGCMNLKFIRSFLLKIPFASRHLFFPLRLMLHRPDVLLAPGGMLPWGWCGRSVLVVHDVAIFEHSEWFPDVSVNSVSTRWLVPDSLRRTDALIAVSKTTAARLAALFPETKEKTIVVEEGIWMPEEEERTIAGEDFVLFLGTIEPRKNLTNAVRAFHQFLTRHPDRARTTAFLLAGRKGWKTEEINAVIQQVNDQWRPIVHREVIRLLGFVNEQQKWSLLRSAAVVLFPSWDEGFGLPVLEAMAVGTPVICSNRGALPEIGGDAVLLVEPDDVQKMALLLAQCLLVPDGVAVLREAGRERAKKYTFERMAEGVMDILVKVSSGGKR